MRKDQAVRRMALVALYAALFIVLDYIASIFGIFKMPQGGTLGISTLALLVASYHLGWKWGMVVAFITVPLQFIVSPPYSQHILDFILEYVLAFVVYGLASIFPSYIGIVITNTVRFLIHWVAGIIYWQATPLGSFTYNIYYMLPTLILGAVLVPLIMKRLKPITSK